MLFISLSLHSFGTREYLRVLPRRAEHYLGKLRAPFIDIDFCVHSSRFLSRYKMISRVSWPNYRGGGDRDAVEALLKDQGMISDATFGKTKVR